MTRQQETTAHAHGDAVMAAENARLREALELAGKRLSAVCGLLETYPRMSQDPNGRTLLDAQEIAKGSMRETRAALAKMEGR